MTAVLDLMGCEPGPRRLPAEPIARHTESSECGAYLWALDRRWGVGWPVGFVMLNPSTGSAKQDDPTVRRVIMFADGWGYRAATIINLYPFVTPHPSAMVA